MALIRSFTPDTRATGGVHPTEVDCKWQVIHNAQGAVLFQLSTYGSDSRESEPKVSQTIQLDREIAAALVTQLQSAFSL